MDNKARRKELQASFKQSGPDAGVYRFLNARTSRALLGSTTNLASIRNKFEFARSTNHPGALDYRLAEDIRQFGFDAFILEVLEVLETKPGMTASEIQDDLATLEALWRERQDPSLLY